MTNEDIIRMAREAGFERTKMHGALERFAYIVAAAEREACAKLCEDLDDGDYAGGDQPYGIHYARAIRARSRNEKESG
jgi:hypothetical protein